MAAFTYNKLRGRIVELYHDQTRFANVLHVPRNYVSRRLNGTTGFTQRDIVEWSELLGIELCDVCEYFFA